MRNLEATHRSASGGPGGRSAVDTARRVVAAFSSAAALVAASALFVAPAFAQGELEGNGIRVGQTRLFPELRLDYVAYDNVFFESDDPTEASAVQLSPSLRWRAERRLVELEASYVGRFSSGSEDLLDFADHVLGVDGSAAPSSRTRLTGYARYRLFGEDLRVREPAADEPARVRVDVDNYELGGWYGYGASAARGNLRLGLDIEGYDPDVEDEDGLVLRRRQFTRVQPYARFSLRVSPDTRWLLEARFSDVSRRDGVDDSRVSLLTGLAFATSGAFGGEFRIGATRIDYDSDFASAENTLRVAASLFYVPTTFSRFDLTLSRDFDPRFGSAGIDSGTADTAITTAAILDWRYAYSERVGHRARLAIEDEDVECPLVGNRQVDVGFELNLRVRRWLELGAGVDHEIDRLDDCGEEGIDIDPDLLETDATRIGAHIRLIL